MNVRSSPARVVGEPGEYAKNFSAAVAMEKTRRFFDARRLYLAASRARPGDAAAALKRATELKRDSETCRLYGQALIGMGEHEGAMTAFARARELDPKNCRVYTSRAVALQRMGAPDAEILAEIDQAIALEPNH